MGRMTVNQLQQILAEEVQGYATPAYRAKTFYAFNPEQSLYAVIFVPDADYPVPMGTEVVVAARIAADVIIIEHDTTDKPLLNELLRRGIPREQIVLAYQGETFPVIG